MRQARSITILAAGWLVVVAGEVRAQPPAPGKLPPFGAVQKALEQPFVEQRGWQSSDLISRSEVATALKGVQQLGWKIPAEDIEKIVRRVLPDDHVLVTTFRTAAGKKFMRQIAGRERMYDRLDRIAEVPGGERLIQDIVKLPDGERYAKPMSGGGVPDLLDLLPKGSTGQTRTIPNYDQRTGHLYTVADLTAAVRLLHRKAENDLTEPKGRN